MTHEEFEQEYNESLWESFLLDNPQATESDAIQFWATIHLSRADWMSNLDVLDAFEHLYKGDKAMALDRLIDRRIEQSRNNNQPTDWVEIMNS